MTATASIGALADELAEVLLRGDPFGASFMAISGYDDAVPDLSPEYQQAWRRRLVDIIVRCAQCEPDNADFDGRVLLETVRDKAARELAAADSRVEEFSVTTFPLGGPSLMLLIASRTRVSDVESATAYLTRCRRIPAYLDQCTARLRTAARDGLLPVAPLVSDAIRQLHDHLSHPARDPMLSHQAPEGWAGSMAGGPRARHPRSGPARHRALRRPARRAPAAVSVARAGRPALHARRRRGVRVLHPERHDPPVRPRRAS